MLLSQIRFVIQKKIELLHLFFLCNYRYLTDDRMNFILILGVEVFPSLAAQKLMVKTSIFSSQYQLLMELFDSQIPTYKKIDGIGY